MKLDLLVKAVQDAADALEAMGVSFGDAFKRRDKREPGRREKEQAEIALGKFWARHFRRQERAVIDRMALVVKAPPSVDDLFEQDEEELAELVRLLIRYTQGGVSLFGSSIGAQIDYTGVNVQAAEWARRHAGKLIKAVDDVSLKAVRSAVAQFVETTGFTLGDIANLLPFSEDRAFRIAVTEVTRAYAQGNLLAGQELKDEYPDIPVYKRWFTNNDDRVCELCGPLDGTEVKLDEPFYPPEDEYADGNPPRHSSCRCFGEVVSRLE